jgi:peptide/nickel transport system ATP-binding protein
MGMAMTEVDAQPAAASATIDPVADVGDLHVTFRRNGHDVHALRGVSLRIAKGEILGLVGESGSGKSVLGFSMLGLLPDHAKTTGTVHVAGADMIEGSPKALRKVRRLDLGAVFQDPMTSLNPTMRIGKQVAEAAGSDDEALRLLTAVGIPEPKRRMRAFPHELSGGLRQRVMIAIAIAGDPDLIVADEPTTALDVTVQAQVLRLLARLRDEIGCSIVFITHDLGVAAQISDRIAVLYAGRVAEIGATRDVLNRPAHPYTHGLLRSRLTLDTARDQRLAALAGSVPSAVSPLPGCAFAPRCVLATEDCSTTPPEPVEIAADRVSACILPFDEVIAKLGGGSTNTGETFELSGPDEDVPPSVVVRDVTKTFTVKRRFLDRSPNNDGKLHALRGISLTVGHGESVALVGESGSGKSTLLRVIAGLENATTGAVRLEGGERPQMVFQDAGASLTPWLSVGELISERLRGAKASRAQRKDAVAEVLDRVGLPLEIAKSRAGQLSGGQRQRVSLARATVVPPSVLLCDEPTSALDVSLAASDRRSAPQSGHVGRLRHPRPVGGPRRRRPDRRDVPGPDRRDRPRRRRHQPAHPPLYPGARRLDTGPRPRITRAGRRTGQSAVTAFGMRIPSALSHRHRYLQRRSARRQVGGHPRKPTSGRLHRAEGELTWRSRYPRGAPGCAAENACCRYRRHRRRCSTGARSA